MKGIFFVLLSFVVCCELVYSGAYDDTSLEQCQVEKCSISGVCCSSLSDNKNNAEIIRYLERDVRRYDKKVEDAGDALIELDKKVESLNYKKDDLLKRVEELKSDLWDMTGIVLGVIALLLSVSGIGGILVFRDFSSTKKSLEVYEREIALKKKEIDETAASVISSMSRKVEGELELFKHKLRLQEIIHTGIKSVGDQAVIYSSVSYLDNFPRPENISIFKNILRLELEDDVKQKVEEAERRAKSSLESSS